MSGSKNAVPEELREALIESFVTRRVVGLNVQPGGEFERRFRVGAAEDADAALAVIAARYPGCWELLERSKNGPQKPDHPGGFVHGFDGP